MGALITRFLPSVAPLLLNPWLILAFVLYSAAITGFAGFQGYRLGENELYKYKASQAAETVKFISKVVTLKETIREPYEVREVEIRNVYHTIESEAENVPNRADCPVTVGWMRVHDAAAENRRIEGTVDDPENSGVTETSAVQTVAGNYKAFHETANDLNACRAFVRGLAQITGP